MNYHFLKRLSINVSYGRWMRVERERWMQVASPFIAARLSITPVPAKGFIIMKSPIITLSLCTLVGVFSYYLGAQQIHDEEISAMANTKYINDLHRLSIYYSSLQRFDEGDYQTGVQQLNNWLNTDLAQISAYVDELPEAERSRVNEMLARIAEHRKQYPKDYYVQDSDPVVMAEKQKIDMLLSRFVPPNP
jgi:hypothetical protein